MTKDRATLGKGLDTMARILYKICDYVIRRFNAPSAGLKSGLNLR
jgi:hypothetical protein